MNKVNHNIQCENCPSKDSGIFCKLERAALHEVSQNKIMNTYKRGQTIFFQGNPPFGLYCISNGKIKVYKTGNDGKETILRIVGPGDVLGHRSLFSNENYNATATVIEDTQVCFIDKNFIHQAIKKEPSIALNLIEKFSREMGTAEARSASISSKSTRERLAELLLSFTQSYGSVEKGRIRLNIKLSREEFASMVGAAQETIIRLFTDFKDEGVLEQEGKVIFIVDKEKLVEIANLDY
ncbi:Crp/Fnr family transcriptional regulator [Peredibacter sp. HCB2-198]|uniref:Crp/Fnr family transcriptional regulator n=1 Tax=Peredibacter sp. HCB2-198 TaxID=3383025 RepID=UPI0038B56B19